jgi:hypothetical protein
MPAVFLPAKIPPGPALGKPPGSFIPGKPFQLPGNNNAVPFKPPVGTPPNVTPPGLLLPPGKPQFPDPTVPPSPSWQQNFKDKPKPNPFYPLYGPPVYGPGQGLLSGTPEPNYGPTTTVIGPAPPDPGKFIPGNYSYYFKDWSYYGPGGNTTENIVDEYFVPPALTTVVALDLNGSGTFQIKPGQIGTGIGDIFGNTTTVQFPGAIRFTADIGFNPNPIPNDGGTPTPTLPPPEAPPDLPPITPDTPPPPLPNPVPPNGVPTITPFNPKPKTPVNPVPGPPQEPDPIPPEDPPTDPEPPPDKFPPSDPDGPPPLPEPPEEQPLPPLKPIPTPPLKPSPSPTPPPEESPPLPPIPAPIPGPIPIPAPIPDPVPIFDPIPVPIPDPVPIPIPTPDPDPLPDPDTPEKTKPKPPLEKPKPKPKPDDDQDEDDQDEDEKPKPIPETPFEPIPEKPFDPIPEKPFDPFEPIPLEIPNNPFKPTDPFKPITPISPGNPLTLPPGVFPINPITPTSPLPIKPALPPLSPGTSIMPPGINLGKPIIDVPFKQLPPGTPNGIPINVKPGGIVVPIKGPIVPIDPQPIDPCKGPNVDPCISKISDIVKSSTANNAVTNAAVAALVAALTPVPIPVKVFLSCAASQPVFGVETVLIPTNSIAYVTKLFEKIANTEGQSCKDVQAIVSVPDHWYYRSGGDVPQLVYIYRQILANGIGSKNYELSIPHPTADAIANLPKLPDYIKGNFEGIIRLSNNYPVVINAKDRAEVIKVWNFVKPLIKPEFTAKFIKKIAEREGQITFEERNCTPWAVDYFSKGQSSNIPRDKRKKF